MKITINTTKQPTPKKSYDALREDIVDKLNKMVGTTEFFAWDYDELRTGTCANVGMHNRLVILLSLFTDSNCKKYGTFTCFQHCINPISFCGYKTLDMLEALEKFIDSIDLNESEIEIK